MPPYLSTPGETGHFRPRHAYPQAYRRALRLLLSGVLLIGVWLLLLLVQYLYNPALHIPSEPLFTLGLTLCVSGVLWGFGSTIAPSHCPCRRVKPRENPHTDVRL